MSFLHWWDRIYILAIISYHHIIRYSLIQNVSLGVGDRSYGYCMLSWKPFLYTLSVWSWWRVLVSDFKDKQVIFKIKINADTSTKRKQDTWSYLFNINGNKSARNCDRNPTCWSMASLVRGVSIVDTYHLTCAVSLLQ